MEPILSLRNVSKRFGGLVANDDISLDVYPGEVVGLLGDNGAGKSTLIKMISGVHQPSSGEIIFEGKPVTFSAPVNARDLGIETIYQDLALARNLDVGSNIFLGREMKRSHFGGLIKTLDRKKMQEESAKILQKLDIHVPSLTSQTGNMSGGQQQAIAIARSIYWNAKLMIMDEPTAALGVPEQRKVLELIRTLRDQNVPVILISHNMPDVFAVCDRIVVLLRGKKSVELNVADTSTDEVVSYIIGAKGADGSHHSNQVEGQAHA